MASAKRPDGPSSNRSTPDAASNSASPEFIRIGRIAGTHGVRGALRYRPDNPDSESLEDLEHITLETASGRREYQVLRTAPAGRGMLKVELEGLSDANAAEALKGATVLVEASKLPETNEREFYYFQAIGCAVSLTDGTSIGTIEEIFSNGANDVMVVKDGKREILVPVIEDVVKSIDLESRRVVIEAVPGLLD